ncbi:MAG: helix-turn-helix transcriptional regulator [Promethearchaeota archaeon]
MNLNEIFIEFSNDKRLIVFKNLYDKEKRHSELEKELNIPGSEISRHLKRLLEKDLIIKTIDNKYTISNIGRIFYRIMDIFEVSISLKEFFNTHHLTSIPVHLILQLGKLKTIEINKKTLQNIELWSNLVTDSQRFIFAISDQLQNSLLPIVEKKIKDQSIDVRALINPALAKSYKIPNEWLRLFKNAQEFFKKLNIYQNIRLLDQINFSLIVSDKGAILFLNKDGQIDYSQCLIDSNDSFINWTIELFEWYWKKGKDLKPFIKRELISVH